jgi:Mg2+ and Co2+ transporter CorA
MPLVDCGPDPPDRHVTDVPEDVRRFFEETDRRGRILELDGVLCARIVAASVYGSSFGLELLQLAILQRVLVIRRRPLPDLPHRPFDLAALGEDWSRIRPEHRDASVLLVAVLDAVIDDYDDVLDVIRGRADSLEEELLKRQAVIRDVQLALLDLNDVVGRVRRSLLALRNDLRELLRLNDPEGRGLVSPAGRLWLETLAEDLQLDLPASLAVAEGRIQSALAQLQGERSEVTNGVVLALTLVTASFFLPTLITGLYGMNTPLPLQHRHGVFWAVLGITVAMLLVATWSIVLLGLLPTLRRAVPRRRRPGLGR